jgi:hypothetical protein
VSSQDAGRAPGIAVGEDVWKAASGGKSPLPPLRRSAFVIKLRSNEN